MSSSITSDLTELIIVANAGNSSFVVQTDATPALYVDINAKVGVNTLHPGAQLEVAGENGSCMRMRYGNTDAHADIGMTSEGDVSINPSVVGRSITSTASLDLINHNGSTTGLKLAGELVEATAAELNYTVATPGVASASKALVLNDLKTIGGIESLSASSVSGTLQTADQPNITSLGTLDSLSVANGIVASTITGAIQTASQPNITSVGTLGSLAVTNDVSASTLTGTLQTADQPNVTSIGNLSSVTIAGSTIGSEAAFLSGTIAGTAANSKAVVLSNTGSVSGIESLSATTLEGTLSTAAQPNITSVGTLTNLNVSDTVSADKVSGTIQTAAQPNITSVGPLSSVSIAGSDIGSEAAFLSGAVAGTAANSKAVVLSSTGSVSGINAISAATVSGTLQTAAQPNITSVGALTSVTVAGSTIGSEAAFLSGAVAGTAEGSKVVVLNSDGSVGGINSLSASNLTGTLQTASQPNITSVGTLSSVNVSGAATFASTSDSTSSTTGAVAISGGVGVAKSIHVGSGIYGTLGTAAQPAITSVGTLSGLTVDGDLEVSGSITMNGVVVGTGGGGATLPEYITNIAPGTAANSKALVLSSVGNISGINSLSAATLGGTLQTAAQPNITSIGALSSVSIGGATLGSETAFLSGATAGTAANSKVLVLSNIGSISGINSLSATTLAGTLSTSSQPGITSIGGLSTISIAGYNIGAEAGFLSGATSGTAANSKALVLSSSGTITGIASLSATNLTGTIQTAAQPKITSLGALTSVSIAGNTIGSEAGFLAGVTAGTAQADKVVVLNSNGSITGITSLSTAVITGTIMTSSQPSITRVGTLLALSTASLTLNNILVTASADEINLLDNVVPGTAVASKALVVDANKDISGIRNLTATGLIAADSITLGGVSIGPIIDPLTAITLGTPASSKALTLDSSGRLNGTFRASGLIIGTSTLGPNLLKFNGTTGDTGNNNTVIAERLYATGTEKSELLLFKGNDFATDNFGPDRIRLRASEHRFQTYTSAEDWSTLADNNDRLVIANNGDVTISKKLIVSNEGIDTTSLKLGGTLITSTAAELNYLDITTIGTAEASKALVLDANKDITGIRNLTATSITGVISTVAQPSITSVGTLTSLTVNNSIQVQNGTGYANVASSATGQMILSTSSDNANAVGGDILLQGSLIVGKNATNNLIRFKGVSDDSTANHTVIGQRLIDGAIDKTELLLFSGNDPDIVTGPDRIRLRAAEHRFQTFTVAEDYSSIADDNDRLVIANNGDVTISKKLIVSNEGIHTVSLTLDGTPITAAKLNYLDITTAGTAQASKALVVDADNDITGIRNLTATSIAGTISTAAQPQITSLGTLTSLSVTGALNATLATAAQPSITSVGTLTSLSVSGSITGTLATAAQPSITSLGTLTSLSVSGSITGTLATAAQPSITSLGTLTSLTVSGDLTLDGVVIGSTILPLVGATAGSAVASKAIVLNTTKDISGINQISSNVSTASLFKCSNIVSNGRSTIDFNNDLRTLELGLRGSMMDQPDTFYIYSSGGYHLVIESNGNMVVGGTSSNSYKLNIVGSLNASSLSIGETLITSSAAQLNSLAITTAGTAEASKTLVLDANRDISNINSLSASQLTGTIQTAAQPSITSVGTLTSLTVLGSITGTLATAAQPSITSVGTLTSLSVSGTLNATLATAAQPSITSVGTLTSLSVTGALNATLATAAQPSITSVGTLTSLSVTGALNASGVTTLTNTTDATSTTSGGSLTVSGGLAVAKKLFVGERQYITNPSGGDMITLTATNANTISIIKFINDVQSWELGSRGSASSPNNSFFIYDKTTEAMRFTIAPSTGYVGISKSNPTSMLDVNGTITSTGLVVNGANIDTTIASLTGITAGTAQASKALVVDANKDITSIRNLTATSIAGTISTAAQPQITSFGTLSTDLKLSEGIYMPYAKEIMLCRNVSTKDKCARLFCDTSSSLVIECARGTGYIKNLTNHTEKCWWVSNSNGNDTLSCYNGQQVGINVDPSATSVGYNLNINGTCNATSYYINGTLITASAAELNYLDITTIGTAQASKTLVVDENKDITGIRTLTATSIAGAIATAAQPQITSLGTLSSLTTHALTVGNGTVNELRFGGVSGDSGTDMCVIANRLYGASDFAEMVLFSGNDQAGAAGPDRIRHRAGAHIWQTFLGDESYSTLSDNNDRMIINNNGDVYVAKKLIVSGEGIDAASLSLNGTPITATANELNYLDITTVGTAEASKALVVDADKDITGIRNLTTTGGAVFTNTTDATSASAGGCLTLSGGLAVSKKMYVGGQQYITIPSGGDMITLNASASTARSALKFNNDAQSWELGSRGSGSSPNSTFYLYDNTAQATRLTVLPTTGYVGIGTSAPVSMLEVNGSITADKLTINANGYGLSHKFPGSNTELITYCSLLDCGIGSRIGVDFRLYFQDSWRVRINGNNVYRIDGASTFTTTSDIRIKEDIVDADTSLCYDFVKNVKLKYYKWKDFVHAENVGEIDNHTLGWIAQDVQPYFPKATPISPNYGIDDLLTLNVDDVYKSLYGCVQQIITDKESLETEVVTLKQQLAAVMDRLAALENK